MKSNRRYDLDWLRVIGVFLVVVFHTCMIFVLESWAIVYTKSDVYIHPFLHLTGFIHVFNMPVLFVVAGMAAGLSLRTRKPAAYLINRVKKLLLPAVLGCALLNPFMTWLYCLQKGDQTGFFEHFIRFFTTNPVDLSGEKGGFTPAHLWFILFLFLFSLLSLPLFLSWNRRVQEEKDKSITRFMTKPFALLIFIFPIGASYYTYILSDKNPITYFLMFILGYLLISRDAYQQVLDRDKWWYLIFGIGCCLGNLFMPDGIFRDFTGQTAAMLLTYAFLGLGHEYLNHESKVIQYLAARSFTFYLIHMLLNTIAGYFILQLPIPAMLQWLLILLATVVSCFVIIFLIDLIKKVFGRGNRHVRQNSAD